MNPWYLYCARFIPSVLVFSLNNSDAVVCVHYNFKVANFIFILIRSVCN